MKLVALCVFLTVTNLAFCNVFVVLPSLASIAFPRVRACMCARAVCVCVSLTCNLFLSISVGWYTPPKKDG